MVADTDSRPEVRQQPVATENVAKPSWWKEEFPSMVLSLLRGGVIVGSLLFMIPYLAVSWFMAYQRLSSGLFPTTESIVLSFDTIWGIVETLCLAWLMNRVFIREYTVEEYHGVRQAFFLKHRSEGRGFLHKLLLLLHISIHRLELLISWPARIWKEENDFDHTVTLMVELVLQFIILTPILLIVMGQVADLCPIIFDWWAHDQPIWAERINHFNEANPEYLIFIKMIPPYIAVFLTAYLFLKIPIFYLLRKWRMKRGPSQ